MKDPRLVEAHTQAAEALRAFFLSDLQGARQAITKAYSALDGLMNDEPTVKAVCPTCARLVDEEQILGGHCSPSCMQEHRDRA